jgi:hypothetical protein
MLVARGRFRVSADTPDQVELFQGVARRVSNMLQRPVVSYANGREIVITFGQQEAPPWLYVRPAGHFPRAGPETGPVTERLRVREIDDDEGRRLVRIIRRGSGSVVTWRRAQMLLLSAQGMDVPGIAKVAFTSEDRVRDVIRNFNAARRGIEAARLVDGAAWRPVPASAGRRPRPLASERIAQ